METPINGWANNRVKEIIRDIDQYINGGMSKIEAIKLAFSHSIIGQKYKRIILNHYRQRVIEWAKQ